MAPEMLFNKEYDGAKSDAFSVRFFLFVLKTSKISFPLAIVRYLGNISLKLYGFIIGKN